MTRALLTTLAVASVATVAFALPRVAHAAPFAFDPPGQLVSGSGDGRVDSNVYAPTMRFPIESGPAFANSQVYAHGGNFGPGGDQCDTENFSYPWHDNYCETRDWDMPLCPSGTGHQGQDIRAATCKKGVHRAVAAEDGTITNVGSYSVYLTAADGTRFDYLHMQDVAVTVGQKVARGDLMGLVSNQFGTSSTTVHLHFNLHQNVAGIGSVYVPPYLSLVKSYQELLGIVAPTGDAGSDAAAASPPPPGPAPPPEAPPAEPEPAPPPADVPESGCAVTLPSRSNAAAGGLLALGAVALAIARRRRHAAGGEGVIDRA